MSYFEFGAQVLQFAMAIGYTYGALVVALGVKEFCGNFLISVDALIGGGNYHIGRHFGSAGRHQPRVSFNFYQAQSAGTYITYTIQVAHGQYFYIICPAYFQYGLAAAGFQGSAIYGDGYLGHVCWIKLLQIHGRKSPDS